MGVGAYSSTFGGTGGTFIVDGLVGGEEEHRKYVLENVPADALTLEQWRKEVAEDPEADEDEYKDYLYELAEEESDSFETWQQDQDEAHVEGIEEIIATAAREIGMFPESHRNGRYTRASFDSDFVSVATGTYVDIGWRSWEHDIIVGVGGSSMARGWGGEPEAYGGEIIDNTGMAPSAFGRIYGELADAVQTYVRLSLMSAGYECSYKTSGYTSSVYQTPEEGFEAALKSTRQEIADLQARIPKSFADGVVLAGGAEREEIVQAIGRGDVNTNIPVVIPLYDPQQDSIVLYANDRKRLTFVEGLPAIREAMQELIAESRNTEDFAAVPRNEDLEAAWNRLQSVHSDKLLVSMEEWIDLVGGDPAIEWRDEDGQEWEADVIVPARATAPAP